MNWKSEWTRQEQIASTIASIAKEYLAMEKAKRYLKPIHEGIDENNLRKFDVIIAMEPKHKEIVLSKCPECDNKIVLWNIEDPYSMPKEKIDKFHTDKIQN